MIKACRDCRYISRNKRNCEHPKSFRELPDYLAGTKQTYARSINAMRTTGECRDEARLFESKKG